MKKSSCSLFFFLFIFVQSTENLHGEKNIFNRLEREVDESLSLDRSSRKPLFRNILEEIEDLTDRIQEEINDAFSSLHRKPQSLTSSMEKRIEQELDALKKREKSLMDVLAEMRKKRKKIKRPSKRFRSPFSAIIQERQYKQKGFSIADRWLDKAGEHLYEINISAPGFEEQNLTIKTSVKDNRLTVEGKKDVVKAKEQKIENDDKQSISRAYFSEQFKYTQIINNKKRKLSYKNGKLEVSVDLPDDIDSKNYDVTFKNGNIITTFSRKEKHGKF